MAFGWVCALARVSDWKYGGVREGQRLQVIVLRIFSLSLGAWTNYDRSHYAVCIVHYMCECVNLRLISCGSFCPHMYPAELYMLGDLNRLSISYLSLTQCLTLQ